MYSKLYVCKSKKNNFKSVLRINGNFWLWKHSVCRISLRNIGLDVSFLDERDLKSLSFFDMLLLLQPIETMNFAPSKPSDFISQIVPLGQWLSSLPTEVLPKLSGSNALRSSHNHSNLNKPSLLQTPVSVCTSLNASCGLVIKLPYFSCKILSSLWDKD